MTVRRAATARSGPIPRVPRAMTHRAAIAEQSRRPRAASAMRARPRASPTGNSATRSPMRRVKVVARSGPTRRAAKVFAKMATGREATVPTARGRRAMATGPRRKFGGDKKFSRGAPDRGPRKDFGSRIAPDRDRGADRGDSKPWQKRDASSPDHAGRNSRPLPRRRAKFRQAAFRQAARGPRRRRASAFFASARGSSARRSSARRSSVP